jgi:hypothetical protein
MKNLTYAKLGWLFVLLWLAFVIGMVLFVSPATASQPNAIKFADFMARFSPMLNSIRKIPNATEWVRFYYAVMWATAPIYMYIGWLLRRRMCIEQIYFKPMSDMKLAIFFICLLGLISIVWIWPVGDGVGRRDQGVVSNIIGVAHFTLISLGSMLILGGYLRIIFSRFYYGNIFEISLKSGH